MKMLNEIEDKHLLWIHATMGQRAYVLRMAHEAVATLRWEKRRRSRAIAESADGSWTIFRKGIFCPRVFVTNVEDNKEVAQLLFRWSTSVATFSNGRTFHWSIIRRQLSQWAWTDEFGERLVQLSFIDVRGETEACVEIASGAQELPELSLLILLGWYLVNTG